MPSRALIEWLPALLIAVPVVFFLGVLVWASAQPPCKRTELRSVVVTEGKYHRGGPQYYKVCIER